MNNIKLTPGVITIILGPQGSGKNALARDIAGAHGVFVEVLAHEILGPVNIGYVLNQQIKTLIVDEMPWGRKAASQLLSLTAAPFLLSRRKYAHETKMVDTPNFIFTADDFEEADVMKAVQGRRHFILNLGPKTHPKRRTPAFH